MTTAPLLVALTILMSVLAATSAVLLWRSDRRVRQLLESLDDLKPAPTPPVQIVDPEGQPAPQDATLRPDASGDVLAGRTDEVDAIVSGETEAGNLLQQTILATHECLDSNLGPGDLADRLNVSLRTLQRNLNTVLRCTPRELILSLKMREAHRLLRSGDVNVTEVAMQLGFSSPSHFSRRFKCFYKISPTEVVRAGRTPA